MLRLFGLLCMISRIYSWAGVRCVYLAVSGCQPPRMSVAEIVGPTDEDDERDFIMRLNLSGFTFH